MNKKNSLFCILFTLFISVNAQQTSIPASSITLQTSHSSVVADGYNFQLNNLPTLQAPAFYSYLWWMGDNGFSFAKSPDYSFQNDWQNSTDNIVAITTDNYGTSGPPPLAYNFTRTIVGSNPLEIVPDGENIYMQNYRNPVIGDTMYLIISYKNPLEEGDAVSGILELELPQYTQLITTMMSSNPEFTPNNEGYMGNNQWEFDALEVEKERSILLPIAILPGVEEELDFKVVYSVEDVALDAEVEGEGYSSLTLEVAESHDPNRMLESSDALLDCNYGGKAIDYRVQFQNTGEGPTDSVRIVCYLDKKLDLKSIRSFEIPPTYNGIFNSDPTVIKRANYTIDETQHTLTFMFHKLILLSPEMPDCYDMEFTKSEVAFTVDVLPNYTFGNSVESRAFIYFDANKPIKTGAVTTSCKEPLPMGQGGGFNVPSKSKFSFIMWGLIIAVLIVLVKMRKKISAIINVYWRGERM